MSDIVKTETIVNGQVLEIKSSLETDKISKQLEDISVKVNELLTSFIGIDDNSSQSSSDEHQDQDRNVRPTGGSEDTVGSDPRGEHVSKGATSRSEASSRGKRQKTDKTSHE